MLWQVKLCLSWQTNMRYQDAELQDPGACRLQHRHPAGFLWYGQARVSSEFMVRSLQPEAILPVWALLKPQGLPERPVQQDLLGCFGAAIVYSLASSCQPLRILMLCLTFFWFAAQVACIQISFNPV